MGIGYACITKGAPYKTNRGFTLANFTERNFMEKSLENLIDLLKILEYNNKNSIQLFRISSDIIPFGSHEKNRYDFAKLFYKTLENIGHYIKKNQLRVSMHPGQYTVLNSPNIDVVNKSIKDIEYHVTFLDAMNLPEKHKIILHIGGIYGNKNEAIKRFTKNYNLLSTSAKKRLVIENDERNFSINDLYRIEDYIGIPIIFDILHHRINHDDDTDINIVISNVSDTWYKNDGPMKIHYSQQDITKKVGAHSPTIFSKGFLKDYNAYFKNKNLDIMFEVKDKDISAIKCNNLINDNKKQLINSQWAKYKFIAMEKNDYHYQNIKEIINRNENIETFYKAIENLLTMPHSAGSYLNTLLYVWGYTKDKVTLREKNHFLKLINENKLFQAKSYLQKCVIKYKIEYILNSYYFAYDND